MKSGVILVLASAILALGAGCGKSKRKKAPEVTYFVHGDPNVLIQDTTKSQSFLTPDNAASFNTFHYAGSMGFIEQEPQQTVSGWDEVEDDNSTDATDDEVESGFELLQYAFTQESATRWTYAPTNGNGRTFSFDLVDGKLNLVAFDGYPVTAEHYSLKTDGTAFSLLISTQDSASGHIVASFYFAASNVVNPIVNGSKDFAFLVDTVKLPWKEDIAVDSCGDFPTKMEATISASLGAWMLDDAPTTTRKTVAHSIRTTYAPFSDLNQHCILAVSNFKLENTVEFYTAGVTLPIYNLASKTLIDSDVMVFMDHSNVAAQMLTGSASPVLTHELGHFFGLGHEFKKAEDGTALHPSIMGYSQGTTDVTSWDFEAIRDLYGESLGLATQ